MSGATRFLAAGLTTLVCGPLAAQGYRLRLDARYQAVSFRGVELDSIPVSQVVQRPGQGPTSPDGFAVDCGTSTPGYCFFFRPGARLRGQPLTTTADLTAWGFGVPGLTIRASGRVATDLNDGAAWPATEPNLVVTEGYAEYASGTVSGRLGRQLVSGRLGYQGFDGARATYRASAAGLEVTGYGGWGLARAVAIPVTSPALNPLDDFQPRNGQLLVGADVSWRRRWFDLRGEYRREVDPKVDYFVAERAAASAEVYPLRKVRLAGGAEYDFANGWWGSAEASASYTERRWYGTVEARRYRPFFDLWTIWGAFSPVPFRSVRANAAVEPVKGLWIRGQGERYWFDEDGADTPLVTAEDRGWRAQVSASATVATRWTLEAGLRSEFGPGASSRTIDGGIVWRPSDAVLLAARGGTLDRPLEFRFSDARVDWVSVMGDVKLSSRFRLASDFGWFAESRRRPDAAAFDLNQVRVSTRLVVSFGSSADRLPRAVKPATPGGTR